MPQLLRRTVQRRKAAENSERKWKEAMNTLDEEYDPLPEILLRSLETCKPSVSNQTNLKGVSKKSEAIQPQMENKTDMCSSSYTILNDALLQEIILSLACPVCYSKEPILNYSKNNINKVENISLTCKKCGVVIFNNSLPPESHFSAETKEFVCKTEEGSAGFVPDMHSIGQNNCSDTPGCKNNGVELLVCDVDIMKQGSEADGQYGKVNDLRSEVRPRVNKKQLGKPMRPCFFCGKMQTRLSRHIKTTHTDHQYVQHLVKQSMEVQAKMMRQLRAEGIFVENQKRIKEGRYDLLRIRNQGTGELSPCCYCRGYYKKKLMWRHKSTCIAKPHKKEQEISGAPPTVVADLKIDTGNTVAERKCSWNEIPQLPEPLQPLQPGHDCNQEMDAPEIIRIRDILDGLEHGHGIFSQQPNVNNFFIKQEKEENVPIPPNGFQHSTLRHFQEGNEDQLLFDSLPAILSNSNEGENQECQTAPLHPKKRRLDHYNESCGGEENNYYVWQDITENDVQNQQLLPCNALYKPNKKRKSRSEFQYQFWKKEDENQILTYFTDMINAMKVPGKDACHEFLLKFPHIKTDWTRVKYKVYNQIQKHRKHLKKQENLN